MTDRIDKVREVIYDYQPGTLESGFRLNKLKNLFHLLELVDSSVMEPFILFRWFDKGYTKCHGVRRITKWPDDFEPPDEFSKKYDVVIWVPNVDGKTIAGWSSRDGLPR